MFDERCGSMIHFTCPEIKFEGHLYRLDISAMTYRYSDNHTSFLLIFKDLSSDILVEKLQATDQYKDLLLATVSHDLRNPLSSIMMSINTVLRNNIPKEIADVLYMAKQSGEFMLFMINDILDFS